ncbi:uncharacterized protein LOC143296125 [Babylonia areolata]|uniref:uncharacterized protein LOC143296125 n=1 Tax=Babylonia areolata TaxID=304850 RepID=UPI003FD078F7
MIRRLSEDVRGQLRTGVALTSVAQCVEELVLNAVDAGATCVAVRVDLQDLMVQVVDNGHGIGKEQLPLVGERYSTSKCHLVEDLDNLRYFGYRGEALASLCSASSFMEIITRPSASTTTYSKCFHKGKPLSVTEPSRPRPGVGTTVTARNLFYNLPVRRKSLNEGLELERTRFRVAGLALMWPLISFSLRDEVTGNVILQTHKCSSILGTFASLFGRSRTKHMKEVECSGEAFKISGYVSRENYSRKDLQFVFVNRRQVLKSKVHKMVNSVLGKSVLVRRRGHAPEKSRQAGLDKRSTENGSPTKLFERYAVYVINIECSVNMYDITFDPAKTLVEFHDWPELTSQMEAMLMKFLKEENLLLPTEDGQEKDETPSQLAAEPDVSVSQTSELCETDDPFDGNDEHFDEEFHDTLQRKRFAQGISTQSNINSLFSRTVRRPAVSLEKEGFVDLGASDRKKSRLNDSTNNTDEQGKQGSSKQDCSDSNTGSGRTALNITPVDLHAKTDSRGDVEETKRQFHKSGKKQSSESVPTSCSDADSELEDREIILPQAIGPSKRRMSRSSQKQTSTEELQDEALCSFSESTEVQIHLPPEFAKYSALSRLRARLAEQLQTPSSSKSLQPPAKTQTVSSKCAAAALKKFHRTGKHNRRKHGEVEENMDLEDEVDTAPTQNVLPPFVRPPFLRSRSLDAKCSCCCVKDGPVQHRHSGSSTTGIGNRHQTCDDINISYTGSSPGSGLMKRGTEISRLANAAWDNLCRKPGLHKETRLSSIQERFQCSRVFHQRQNDSRKSKHLQGVQKVPHNVCNTEMRNKSRKVSMLSAGEAGHVRRHSVPKQAQSESERGCAMPSKRALSSIKPRLEASGSDLSRSRAVGFHNQRDSSGQSHQEPDHCGSEHSHQRPHHHGSEHSHQRPHHHGSEHSHQRPHHHGSEHSHQRPHHHGSEHSHQDPITMVQNTHIKDPITMVQNTHIMDHITMVQNTHIKDHITMVQNTHIKDPITMVQNTHIKDPITMVQNTHIMDPITMVQNTHIMDHITMVQSMHLTPGQNHKVPFLLQQNSQ